MTWNPDDPKERWGSRIPEPPREIRLMTEAESLAATIDASAEVRTKYGVRKAKDGFFVLEDFWKYDRLPFWQKEVLHGMRSRIKDEVEEIMAIPRNHRATGFIDKAGEYKVRVDKIDVTKSKKGAPMLTVTFLTDRDQRIKAYFVKTINFHMKALDDCKAACGLKPSDAAENLIGKRLGIAVGPQPEGPDGRIYFQVEGYGKEADVEEEKPQDDFGGPPPTESFEDVPF